MESIRRIFSAIEKLRLADMGSRGCGSLIVFDHVSRLRT